MKKLLIVGLLLLFTVGVIGCSNQTDLKSLENNKDLKIEYKNISPIDAKKRLEKEEGIILLDVRTLEEYTEKHIPGSILIPVEVIEKEAQAKLKNKDATIFVYCRSGRRSVIAAEILVKQGYKNVFNLGGINDWQYETEVGAPK